MDRESSINFTFREVRNVSLVTIGGVLSVVWIGLTLSMNSFEFYPLWMLDIGVGAMFALVTMAALTVPRLKTGRAKLTLIYMLVMTIFGIPLLMMGRPAPMGAIVPGIGGLLFAGSIVAVVYVTSLPYHSVLIWAWLAFLVIVGLIVIAAGWAVLVTIELSAILIICFMIGVIYLVHGGLITERQTRNRS